MPGPQYQIIAEAPTDDFAVLERVQKGLSRTFKLDLAAQRNQLRRGGVCVCRADSLPTAQQQAEIVRGIGADFRILDAQGRVVGRGDGRRGGAEPAAARLDATIRGAGAGAAFPGTPTPNRLSVDPLARTSATGGGPIAPSTSGLDLMPTGNDALDSSAPKYNLEAVESDDLVLLDGSREDAPAARVAAPSPTPAKPPPPVSAAAFAPPVEDEVLELAEEPRRARPAAPPVPKLPGAAPPLAPEPEPEDAPPLTDLMPTATPPAEPARAAAGPARATRPAPATPAARAATPAARSTRPPRTAARGGDEERVLFGGWFRARPRLRIALGFLVALALGSIAPILQSRSVVTERVRPQLEDLVTARAHGHILARLPNYRSPEEIEEAISSIKTRNGVTTYVIWLAVSGLLVFLWFRFV